MKFIDIVILIIVFIILGSVILFSWVLPGIKSKKTGKKACCCGCPMGNDIKAKRIVRSILNSKK